MIKMVVFDMAGTTIDENNVVYKTLQTAINAKGYQLSLEEVLGEGAGKEKRQAIRDILKTHIEKEDELLGNSIYEDFIVRLKHAYETLPIKPIHGADELFKSLKERNMLVVLNTGYDEATASSLLRKLGWHTGLQIDGLVTASDVTHNRPAPDMIFLAMKKFDIKDAREVAKIGDSSIDIEEGKNAGCGLTIGITTGAHTRTQLLAAGPDLVIDDLTQVFSAVHGKQSID